MGSHTLFTVRERDEEREVSRERDEERELKGEREKGRDEERKR